MNFCVEAARRGRRRRGGARAGRHRPLQLPVRHRLAPAGRRRRHAGLPARRRADRLRDDQGPLARHRRQGAVLHRHRRRLPGGDDLPRREAVQPRASSWTTSTGWRSPTRGCRRWSPATSTRRWSASAPAPRRSCGSSSATGSRRSSDVGRADVRPRRGGRAQLLREDSGRPLRRPRQDGRQRDHVRRRVPFEVVARGRRLDGATRLLARAGRAAGPDQLPARRRPSRRAASRSRCSPAAARRRTRATSGRSRWSRGRARCSTRTRRRRASSTAGPAMQAIEVIYQAVAEALPEAVPACSGGDICALVWWGMREETGEPWADGSPHPVGQGGSIHGDGASSLIHHAEAATRFSPTEVWEAKNPWLLEQVELAAGLVRAGPASRRARRRLLVPRARGLLRDVGRRADEDAAVGPRRRRRGAAERRRRTCSPDGSSESLRQGDAAARCRRARRSTSTPAAAAATGRRPSATPRPCAPDVREGYITEEHARRHYPHAF